jgi:hypothetical protein
MASVPACRGAKRAGGAARRLVLGNGRSEGVLDSIANRLKFGRGRTEEALMEVLVEKRKYLVPETFA